MARYYNRGWRRSWYRRGSYAKQKSGNRYFTVSFPVETILNLYIPANQYLSNVVRTNPYLCYVGTSMTDGNVAYAACSLLESAAYRTYTNLYDSVKINSVSIKYSIAATVGEGGIPALRCYTSWDRGLCKSDSLITEEQLLNGPESQVVTFINNSRAKFSRYNAARDLQERTTFHDCTYKYTANQHRTDVEWFGDGTHAPSVGYVPSCALVLQASNTTETQRNIPIQIQATYSVTFRNPKYGLSVSGSPSKFGEEAREVLSEAREIAEEKSSEGSPLKKKEKIVYEEEVLPDDPSEMDEESQEMSKEELLAEIARLKGESK